MTARAPTLSAAKGRVLRHLKLHGPCTAANVAEALGLTVVAVRQHLGALEEAELASHRVADADGPGRPPSEWLLTDSAAELFPDRHGELTVALLSNLRKTFGEDGLERLVSARADEQASEYRAAIPESASLETRLEALAGRRTDEGYMAEVRQEPSGDWLLIEHHCPICEAARACAGLCTAELDVFRRALGPSAEIERTQHLLAGDPRCVYRVRSAGTD